MPYNETFRLEIVLPARVCTLHFDHPPSPTLAFREEYGYWKIKNNPHLLKDIIFLGDFGEGGLECLIISLPSYVDNVCLPDSHCSWRAVTDRELLCL